MKNRVIEIIEGCGADSDSAKEAAEEIFSLVNVRLSLLDAKKAIAEYYGKENWKEVQRDFEHGIGISKLIDFESLMDVVAHRMQGNES